MLRVNRLVIPLRTDERSVIDRWAKSERLPTATAVRKVLLDLAQAQGVPAAQGDVRGTANDTVR